MISIGYHERGIPGYMPMPPAYDFYDVQYADQIVAEQLHMGRYGTMVKLEPYQFGRPVILSIARDLWEARRPWFLSF